MMRLLPLLGLISAANAQVTENEILPDKIPHVCPVDFQESSILVGFDGHPAGIIEGVETIIPDYKPPLPERSKIARIEYGQGPASKEQEFIVTESKEIDLIYGMFERFSSQRLIQRKYYKLSEDGEVEELELGELSRFGMHLCTNGFRFYSGDEMLLAMDSHSDDEAFFGDGFHFFNHPMVAYIKFKKRE